MDLGEHVVNNFELLNRYFIEDRYIRNILQRKVNWQENNNALSDEVDEGIFKNFSEFKLKQYINDQVLSILLSSVFTRFGNMYKKQMHPKSRKRI